MATIAPRGGTRIRGRNYKEGARIPSPVVEQYARRLETPSRPTDPGRGLADTPPNLGRAPVPHVLTFQGIYTSLAKAYQVADAAILHNREYAEMMRLDDVVTGPLFARQQMTAMLNWDIEPEDASNPALAAIAREIRENIGRIENFVEYKRNCLEAIWYGRYGIQNKWRVFYDRANKRRYGIEKWVPLHGDKLVFRYDDGTGTYDENQIGIRVSPVLARKDALAGNRQIEYTPDGTATFLEPWERSLLTIHKYMVCDSAYESPMSGGSIHGTGVRHFLYWTWYAKQETFAQLMELMERTASGITVYRYPYGNDEARAKVEAVAQQQAHTNVLLMPSDPEDPDAYAIEVIPTAQQGIDALHDLIHNYFNDQITRFILGQTLSRKSDATGLGSGVADLHEDSMLQIIQYDAYSLEQTLTRELVHNLVRYNYPKYAQHDFKFVISTKQAATDERLAAMRQLYDMGVKLRTADLLDIVGVSLPKGSEDFVSLEQQQQAQGMGANMGLQMGAEAADMGSGFAPDSGGLPPQINSPTDNGGGQAPPTADPAELFAPVLYARQLGLFGEDFEPAKDKTKPTAKATKETQGKLFSTSGTPGQTDFMGEAMGSEDKSQDVKRSGATVWDEDAHPRHAAGDSEGGRFTSKADSGGNAGPRDYETMKAEYDATVAVHPRGSAESSKAYKSFLDGLSREESKEFISKKSAEERKARRSKSAKKGAATKQRKKAAAEEKSKDPAGKIVQETQAEIESLMQRWQTAPSSMMADIEAQVDALQPILERASDDYQLRQRHETKAPQDVDRNRDKPQLGSDDNKEATKADRTSGIPWSVAHFEGKEPRIIRGASLGVSVTNSNNRYISLHEADGTDSNDGFMIHYPRGDQERNKRARQIVWAIANGRAEDVYLTDLEEYLFDGEWNPRLRRWPGDEGESGQQQYARPWDESQHPRRPAGSEQGGEFTDKPGGGVGRSVPKSSIPTLSDSELQGMGLGHLIDGSTPPQQQQAPQAAPQGSSLGKQIPDEMLAGLAGATFGGGEAASQGEDKPDWSQHGQWADQAREEGRRAPRGASRADVVDVNAPSKGLDGIRAANEKMVQNAMAKGKIGQWTAQTDGTWMHKDGRRMDGQRLAASVVEHLTTGGTGAPPYKQQGQEVAAEQQARQQAEQKRAQAAQAAQEREQKMQAATAADKERRRQEREARKRQPQLDAAAKAADAWASGYGQDGGGNVPKGTPASQADQGGGLDSEAIAKQTTASVRGREWIRAAKKMGLPAGNAQEARDSLDQAKQMAGKVIDIAKAAGYEPEGVDLHTESQSAFEFLQGATGQESTGDDRRDMAGVLGALDSIVPGASSLLEGMDWKHAITFVAAFWMAHKLGNVAGRRRF